jgi:hypothetical protein
MSFNEILAQLKFLGDDARRAHNTKAGAPDNQFGVKLGDIRVIAKKIKTDHELALNSGTRATSKRNSSPRSSSSPSRSPLTNSTS